MGLKEIDLFTGLIGQSVPEFSKKENDIEKNVLFMFFSTLSGLKAIII